MNRFARLLPFALLASILSIGEPAAADELVFRIQGTEDSIEIIRGEILSREDGVVRIQVAYGIITKPEELLLEVRPGIEDVLAELTPDQPVAYLAAARQIIEKQGTVDLGEDYSLERARLLVHLAVRLDGGLYVEAFELLMGSTDAEGRLVGGIRNPHAALRYAERILRVDPGHAAARAVLAAARSRVGALAGDFQFQVSAMLRAYADGDLAAFLRQARPFARADSAESQALAARGDTELARHLEEVRRLACEACQFRGHQDCRRCGGDGERPTNCPECAAKGYLVKTCGNCLGKGRFPVAAHVIGAWEECKVCVGKGKARYACETCGGERYLPRICEDCQGTGHLECQRCRGTLWKDGAQPALSPEAARRIADRYDPDGTARLGDEGPTGAADARPLRPMGAREIDPDLIGQLDLVVFHDGRWMTVEDKVAAIASEGR